MMLEEEIDMWEGKAVDIVDDVYNRYQGTPDFAQRLVDGLKLERLQRGASWLLKRHLEVGGVLTKAQIRTVYQTLPALAHWETRLHLLQSMRYMPIEEEMAKPVEQFLKSCLADKKKFVKAWAYNGYHLLGQQHLRYQAEAQRLLQRGLEVESGSIKARIRNSLKGK